MSILELLEIKHPIFLAPMAGVSTPELAAEVSNQGAFGALGLGANSAETAKFQILKTQELKALTFLIVTNSTEMRKMLQAGVAIKNLRHLCQSSPTQSTAEPFAVDPQIFQKICGA